MEKFAVKIHAAHQVGPAVVTWAAVMPERLVVEVIPVAHLVRLAMTLVSVAQWVLSIVTTSVLQKEPNVVPAGDFALRAIVVTMGRNAACEILLAKMGYVRVRRSHKSLGRH